MRIRWGLLVGLLTWGTAAYGVARLHELPGGYLGFLCGPWGCLPTLWSLVAMHGSWCLALVPIVALFSARLSTSRLRMAGTILIVIGILGTVVLLSTAGWQWLSERESLWRYTPAFMLFELVKQVDFSPIPIALAGLACDVIADYRTRRDLHTTMCDHDRMDHESHLSVSESLGAA